MRVTHTQHGSRIMRDAPGAPSGLPEPPTLRDEAMLSTVHPAEPPAHERARLLLHCLRNWLSRAWRRKDQGTGPCSPTQRAIQHALNCVCVCSREGSPRPMGCGPVGRGPVGRDHLMGCGRPIGGGNHWAATISWAAAPRLWPPGRPMAAPTEWAAAEMWAAATGLQLRNLWAATIPCDVAAP